MISKTHFSSSFQILGVLVQPEGEDLGAARGIRHAAHLPTQDDGRVLRVEEEARRRPPAGHQGPPHCVHLPQTQQECQRLQHADRVIRIDRHTR